MNYSVHKEIPKTDKRQKIWRKQRNERGFDDTETWNLDRTISKFIVPRLKVFAEKTNCFPNDLTFEKWKAILEDMIWSFNFISDIENVNLVSKNDYKRYKKGLKLFAKYFDDLWW